MVEWGQMAWMSQGKLALARDSHHPHPRSRFDEGDLVLLCWQQIN
jgi:hypothetical protein